MKFSRIFAHKFNILHKGIGALVVDSKNKIFVHKRSKMKKVFPSMLDMFIGLKKSFMCMQSRF